MNGLIFLIILNSFGFKFHIYIFKFQISIVRARASVLFSIEEI